MRIIKTFIVIWLVVAFAASAFAIPREKGRKGHNKTEEESSWTPKSLESDPAIQTGSLPNGVVYYLAENPSEKGLALFALVQKTGATSDDSLHTALSVSRSIISDIRNYSGQSSSSFFTYSGEFAGPVTNSAMEGTIKIFPDATIYNFGTLPISGRDAVMDSTIMMIFSVIESVRTLDEGRYAAQYPTNESAVVIVGDIDKKAVLEKMTNMSLAAQKSVFDRQGAEYKWIPRDTVRCRIQTDSTAKVPRLTVSYKSTRTPKEYMGTVLPVMSEYMGDVLGVVLKKRLTAKLRRDNIPVADIQCTYRKSSDQPFDEKYEVSVYTAPEYMRQVCSVVASAICDLDQKGMLPQEFADARAEFLLDLYHQSLNPLVSNESYMTSCISAFLYGTIPTTAAERYDFLARGDMKDTTNTRLINNFAAELFDKTANLTLSLTSRTPIMSGEELKSLYTRAWDEGRNGTDWAVYAPDHKDLEISSDGGKVKVRHTRQTAIVDANLWEFANGMKVIYKRMVTDGLFYYNLLIRGGFSAMRDMNWGEGAFLSDILETYDIAGLDCKEFYYMMQANGISMASEVTATDLSLYGMAPRPALTLLMKSLSAVANSREINQEYFDYYRNSELLRLKEVEGTKLSRMAVVDSLLAPSYRLSSGKMSSALAPDLAERASRFFDESFSKVNDGVLVIIGDTNEDIMKKFLTKYLGEFRTQDENATKSRHDYQSVSGAQTHIVDGRTPSVDVSMSAPFVFTATNYMALRVAQLVVQDAVNKALDGYGAVAAVTSDFMCYPQDRATLTVGVSDVDINALPLGQTHESPLSLLAIVRKTLSELSSKQVSPDMLKLCKNVVKNEIASREKDPWYWIEVVKARYSLGKDLNTKYSERIDEVTAETVQDLISSLNDGSKVEYVVR